MKKIVLAFALVLTVLWFFLNYGRMADDQDLVIRMVLGTLFAVLILTRSQTESESKIDNPEQSINRAGLFVATSGIAGAMLMVAGIMFSVHQSEWVGLLLVLCACFRWALPGRYRRDIVLGLFLFYWVHPLSSQIFVPLQLSMQRMSVIGSEMLLHGANVRVWADGMMLRTAGMTFGVPESCSGMRTAVTVLLCTLGTSVLFRFRWYETLSAVICGLAQVLLFNVLRISSMVWFAPKMPSGWADTFLHDTTGIFLLAVIFLIQVELAWWHAFRVRRRRAANRESRGRDANPFTHWWIGRVAPVLVILALAVVVALVSYKLRPFHRAMMIQDVAAGLMESDSSTAERACAAAQALVPEDIDILTLLAQIRMNRKKYTEGKATLDLIPVDKRRVYHTVLMAWGEMGLGRISKAIELVASVPDSVDTRPAVAMIRAEFAAMQDDTVGVVANMPVACVIPRIALRMRGLFPYLAARGKWATIAECHIDKPYDDPVQSLIAVHAFLKMGRVARMARILSDAYKKYPEDLRFLEYEAMMAVARPGEQWEDVFSREFTDKVDKLPVEALPAFIDYGFGLSRPDIAWRAFGRLKELDPIHPALSLSVARFGDRWFAFRKRRFGMPSSGMSDEIDLRRFYQLSHKWPVAPLVAELADGLTEELRAGFTERARDERFQRNKSAAEEKPGETMQIAASVRASDEAGNTARAWGILNQALDKYKDDPILVECLSELAAKYPDSKYEQRFERDFASSFQSLDADQLSAYLLGGFKMVRPDIAWQAYNRLKEIDQTHPSLFLAPATFGGRWFVFRAKRSGVLEEQDNREIDLRQLYVNSLGWPEAPLAQDMISGGVAGRTDEFLAKCLNEVLRRGNTWSNASFLSLMSLPAAFESAGDIASAHISLDALVTIFPEKKSNILLEHARLYGKEGKWERLYEAIRQNLESDGPMRLAGFQLQINSLMHLGLDMYALALLDVETERYPESPVLQAMRAAMLAARGSYEEALFEIQKSGSNRKCPLSDNLLRLAQRYPNIRGSADDANTDRPFPVSKRQAAVLPPAELAIEGLWGGVPEGAGMDDEDERLSSGFADRVSPFVRGLAGLKADWYRRKGNLGSSDPECWEGRGRDDMERAMLLYELAVLLGSHGRKAEGLAVAERAVRLVGKSRVLRRLQISLSAGEPETVAKAYEACPADPEIWLAWLVTGTRSGSEKQAWALTNIEQAVRNGTFSVGTMIRAGDYLLRRGIPDAAEKAAVYALEKGGDFLPSYVLGMKCALMRGDVDRAMLLANGAAMHSVSPEPFWEAMALVETTMSPGKDYGSIKMIEKLRSENPADARWAQALGGLYLSKEDPDESLEVLGPLVEKPWNSSLAALLTAAEAARRTKKIGRSIQILDHAYALYPSNRVVLNNLVYSLALDADSIDRAKSLLPKLLDAWPDSYAVMDTAAVVYRNAGDTVNAVIYLQKATQLAAGADAIWKKANPYAVDFSVYNGDYDRGVFTNLSREAQLSATVLLGRLDSDIKALSAELKQAKGK